MTDKITLASIASFQNDSTAVAQYNSNNALITTAFDNTLSRDGTSPNQMSNNLDMNSNQILNLPVPATTQSPLRLQDLNSFIGGGTISTVPAGGTTGQALVKTSNVDYAMGWSSSIAVSAGTLTGTTLASNVINSSLTSVGTIGTGVWQGTTLAPHYGGTGINNGTSTLSIGVNNIGFTTTGPTALTLPTSGTVTALGNTVTGSGSIVLATSPTLTTPVLGAATATSINGNTFTTGTYTLTGGTGKTLTFNNSLTLAGTDATTITFQGTDTYVGRTTTDTLTNKTISGSSNTLSNIGNSSLTNSSVTVAGTSIALGASGALTAGTNTLGGDVLLNNTSNFFDGPSVAQGSSGTWYASGTITVQGAGGDSISVKLWDGTTPICSTTFVLPGASASYPISLSGILTSPAGNLRMSAKDNSTTSGVIKQSNGLTNNASVLTVFRIG